MRKERGTSLVGPVVKNSSCEIAYYFLLNEICKLKEQKKKNPPPNAGGTALIPGRGTKIPYTAGQLQNLHHQRKILHTPEKIPWATAQNQCSKQTNKYSKREEGEERRGVSETQGGDGRVTMQR